MTEGDMERFIGRKKELALMEEMQQAGAFRFLILYGRRRVGKTSLLQHYAKKHRTFFYSAQEKNDALNLKDFSHSAQQFFEGKSYGVFDGWESAFRYVADKAQESKGETLTIVIDEFPFIAEENPSVKSILQHLIDHQWKERKLFLILCGSSVSFMENQVMGYKSPLYGRSTTQLELAPFDYLESSLFFPRYTNEEKLLAYGILGGIPCYLQAFDDKKTIAENLASQVLRTGSFLKEEPQLLLKMELREPAIYNSIFEAIASGASRMNDIATKIHEESNKCAKYINTLRSIRLVEKVTPCGESESSRKTLYQISDHYFQFWYRYLFSNKTYYEFLGEKESGMEIVGDLSDYMGGIFERICTQYMIRQAKTRKLPFIPHHIGRWWGNDPRRKRQDDIDILALDQTGNAAIFCECKFRNEAFDMIEYRDLMEASAIFSKPQQRYYYIFAKGGFTDDVRTQAEKDCCTLVGIDDLFAISS